MASRIRQATDAGADAHPDSLVGARQIAEKFGVNRRTAYRWIDRQDFPAPVAMRRVGRAGRGPQWRLRDVRNWWARTVQDRVGGWRPCDLEGNREYRCPDCGKIKPRGEFYEQTNGGKRGRNGVSHYCRSCHRRRGRERRRRARAKVSQRPPRAPTE